MYSEILIENYKKSKDRNAKLAEDLQRLVAQQMFIIDEKNKKNKWANESTRLIDS